MRTHLTLLALNWRERLGGRLLIALGPILPWLEKPLSTEETRLSTLATEVHPAIYRSLMDSGLRDHWRGLSGEIETVAREAGADFIDFGEDPFFQGEDWLFFDHIHPTEAATRHFAERVSDWVGS